MEDPRKSQILRGFTAKDFDAMGTAGRATPKGSLNEELQSLVQKVERVEYLLGSLQASLFDCDSFANAGQEVAMSDRAPVDSAVQRALRSVERSLSTLETIGARLG